MSKLMPHWFYSDAVGWLVLLPLVAVGVAANLVLATPLNFAAAALDGAAGVWLFSSLVRGRRA